MLHLKMTVKMTNLSMVYTCYALTVIVIDGNNGIGDVKGNVRVRSIEIDLKVLFVLNTVIILNSKMETNDVAYNTVIRELSSE